MLQSWSSVPDRGLLQSVLHVNLLNKKKFAALWLKFSQNLKRIEETKQFLLPVQWWHSCILCRTIHRY